MGDKIQLRRGLSSIGSTTILDVAELGYDTDLKVLRIGDGITAGGVIIDPAVILKLWGLPQFFAPVLNGVDNDKSARFKFLKNMTIQNVHFLFVTSPSSSIIVKMFKNNVDVSNGGKGMSSDFIWTSANINFDIGDILHFEVVGSANGFKALTCEPEAVNR